ncbi:hypothetical protein GCM10012290_14930 [Halolactibacillus alkaliphilus]|uniref:GGDEF domain-containing protein n=1 Tax=Halolactibacillus alkaliphilus TaxID=442899 RepID=A0A511X1E9_9BACI|nr:sensor domain-containing diguanylate cyclase [Halolactibacillus alkaliphilus]GEN56767.1 hypothetical protein HAL01_12310 [Halolactibacillus alkaliphilus]GGN70785.1 hypothetical protein GCM10012290_14930 [Halolactibacillus alkaliphilus]SFO79710.1 diguanylate cyclase (GGDEF) domain-containing protein [Halolactibacillus alkaliphilus]
MIKYQTIGTCSLLFILGVVLRVWDFQLSYSLYLPLYFFVPILALRVLTLKHALILTSVLSVVLTVLGDPLIFHTLMISHVIIIGLLFRKYQRNLFTWAIIYGALGYIATNIIIRVMVDNDALQFIYIIEALSYWLMLLFTSLFVDTLFILIPQVPFLRKLIKNRDSIRFNQLIFMGVNIVAIVPLVIITIVQSIALEQQMLESFDQRVMALEEVLNEQIKRLDETEIQRLELGSAIDRGRLTEVIDRHIASRNESVYMFNKNGERFLHSSEADRFSVFNDTLTTGSVQTRDNHRVWLSGEGLTPRDWYNGYYMATFHVLDRPVEYFIAMDTAVFQSMSRIYHYHMLMFAVFLTSFVIGLLSERILLGQIEGITVMAEQIPRSMMTDRATAVPQTRILEVKILTERLTRVDQQLRLMFKELSKTNRELNEKTSELNASRQELYHVAHHDSLTDLPNRRLFYHTLEKKVNRNDCFGLFFLDLNDFKDINDQYGHKEGDQLLKDVALRLVALEAEFPVRFYRLAGDEFVAILKRDRHEEVSFFTKILKKTFSAPFMIQDDKRHLSVSIGLSLMPEDGSTFETLLHIADQAMYEDKRISKGRK